MALPLFAPRRAPGDGSDARFPTNTRVASVVGVGAGAYGRGREVAALLFWTAALFLALALGSYAGEPHGGIGDASAQVTEPGADWVGTVGEFCARFFVTLAGLVAWCVPLELALLGIPFVRGKPNQATVSRLAGDILIGVLAASLVQVGWPKALAFGAHPASGLIGELFGELARALFSTVGSFLVGFASLGLILIGRATFSFIALARVLANVVRAVFDRLRKTVVSLVDAWQAARDLEDGTTRPEPSPSLPVIALPPDHADHVTLAPDTPQDSVDVAVPVDVAPLVAPTAAPTPEEPLPAKKGRKKKAVPVDVDVAALVAPAEPEVVTPQEGPSEEATFETPEPEESSPDIETPVEKAVAKPKRRPDPKGPNIIDTSSALARMTPAPPAVERRPTTYHFPSVEFLAAGDPTLNASLDRDKLLATSELLIKALADYGVQGKVEEVHPGPTVTTYEVSPVAGTKVSKVAGLADDLALALATRVRIVAPIPGKGRIGFELPNEQRIPVMLRELIEDARFQSLDVPLPVVLGRDIVGRPVYADLSRMPHVIVAGATGAGKSVGLNVMLTSLLYRRAPADLRFLMIDPKVVELAPFDRIPHMLLPVVTDMKQAATALKWAVDEMERRYQLFADAGTRNIGTYNDWVVRVRRGEIKNPRDIDPLDQPEGAEVIAPLPEKLPFIVVVVDEFADLMMQQGKDVETAIARLAQKARAAGMHVILATQRPSTDVITGMIKANFPTRIAYRVAQKIDSRVILDEMGADHLLGNGDMLVKMNGTTETRRVQCPWVSEAEVQAVTDFVRAQGEPVYDDAILKPRDEDEEPQAPDEGEKDPMYGDAVRIVSETRRCSTSWLQRKLEIGYNRAARIVETMERRGLVGPQNGAKEREVLIGPS
jgi:S-DNA-T family DNA segregation ATPase FtsK/SpoIIIE